ncbi:MAG TPA: four helix bundle protein [Chitinophagaceae bacterium]|nr:four helix bundle protein [Chitinophagaceae bacterium]
MNIAEGYGRFSYKENRNFNYYSRGSAFECTSCLTKAYNRGLVSAEENQELRVMFEKYFKLVNGYIKAIGRTNNSDQVSEAEVVYEKAGGLEDLLTND